MGSHCKLLQTVRSFWENYAEETRRDCMQISLRKKIYAKCENIDRESR